MRIYCCFLNEMARRRRSMGVLCFEYETWVNFKVSKILLMFWKNFWLFINYSKVSLFKNILKLKTISIFIKNPLQSHLPLMIFHQVTDDWQWIIICKSRKVEKTEENLINFIQLFFSSSTFFLLLMLHFQLFDFKVRCRVVSLW